MINSSLFEKAGYAVREFHELIDMGLINKSGEYVSTLMYPPPPRRKSALQYPLLSEDEFLKGYTRPEDNSFVIYAHSPFCMGRCHFCHMPNIIPSSDGEKDAYLEHFEKEVGIYLARLGVSKPKARSILIGGGTPTYLTPAQLTRFLRAFTSRLELGPETPFSCDVDPLTVIGDEGRERLKILKSFNVNRLSLGVQTFSDELLRSMNRHHNADDTIRAIGQIKELGFKLDIDLIYGYPGGTREDWAETLEKACRYEVDEIMIHRINIIPNAASPAVISALRDQRESVASSNDEDIRLKAIAVDFLESQGYSETIGRSFSKRQDCFSDYRNDLMSCRYDAIGFGYYAMSALRDRTGHNTCDMKEYFNAIRNNKLPIKTGLLLSKAQQRIRDLILPFKNRELSKKWYQERAGAPVNTIFAEKIRLLEKFGLLEEDAEFLRPTKKGRFFIDEVTQFFYDPGVLPFAKEEYKEGPLNPYLAAHLSGQN